MTQVGLISQNKLNWTLYDWNSLVGSENFQSWLPFFIFYFNRLYLNSLLFTFPAHKYSLPQTLKGLAHSLLQFTFPKSQYSTSILKETLFCNFELASVYLFISFDTFERTSEALSSSKLLLCLSVHTST